MITPFQRFKTIDDIRPYLDDDNSIIYPICDNVMFVANKCVDPFNDDCIVYDKDQATILGLYHKQVMLYLDYIQAYKENKLHLIFLYQRIIYEAYIKMRYLMKYGADAQNSYRLYSYKNRKDFFDSHSSEDSGYFKVRNDKFLLDLAEDDFNLEDFKNMNKSFGGKNFKQLVAEFSEEDFYSSIYGIGSDSIHSDWGEIRQVYVHKTIDNKYTTYNTNKQNVHFRILIPIADLIIDSSIHFINWNQNIDSSLNIMLPYKDILIEMKRMCRLIMTVVFEDYQKNPDKYMSE